MYVIILALAVNVSFPILCYLVFLVKIVWNSSGFCVDIPWCSLELFGWEGISIWSTIIRCSCEKSRHVSVMIGRCLRKNLSEILCILWRDISIYLSETGKRNNFPFGYISTYSASWVLAFHKSKFHQHRAKHGHTVNLIERDLNKRRLTQSRL